MRNRLEKLCFTGTPQELGSQQGKMLGKAIHECYAVYSEIWNNVSEDRLNIESTVKPFSDSIKEKLPHLATEIESLAHAAKIPSWKVYALNARSEIYNIQINKKAATKETPNECTTLFFPISAMLGQTWDWSPKLESLFYLAEYQPKDHPRFLTVSEPGIIGKIGLNENGLGVCLNMLNHKGSFKGIPIHILLRLALSSTDLNSAISGIKELSPSTASAITLADESGKYVSIEFAGRDMFELFHRDNTAPFFHTNHYLGKDLQPSRNLENSINRLNRCQTLCDTMGSQSASSLKLILEDQSGQHPILRPYRMSDYFMVGTVTLILINLPTKTLSLTPGGPDRLTYQHVTLAR